MDRPSSFAWLDRHAGWIAAASCAAAALGFAAVLPEFSHVQHPLALLGAKQIPHASAFNLLAFVVPGLLAAWTFARLRARMPAAAGRMAGVGAWTLAISGLAFAGQGLWPLDPANLDEGDSRLHAVAWLLWWLSFASGALLAGAGLRARAAWRTCAVVFLGAGGLTVVLNVLPATWMPGPIAQRVVLAAWLACVVLASRQR